MLCGALVLTPCGAEDKGTSLKPIPESAHYSSGMAMDSYGASYGADCPYCESGMMNGGMCQHCQGHGRGRRSPGAGWCAPTKVTMQRERVQYWKWYPNYWSGYGPGPATPYYPMVYTPTDTAQLGFYYQHVPHWTAQPWRTPGPAHPAAWHNRYCGRSRNDAVMYQSGYSYGDPHGGYYNGYEQVIDAQPMPAPTKATPVPAKEQPQTLFLPEPSFVPSRPVISVLPDAPPEV